jgi:CelD/BcsL family acetyltransferase involved in cellulose biosynthesis
MSSLAVEEVESRSALEPLREEWQELVHSVRGSFFATDLFVCSYLDSKWLDRPMRVLFVRDERRLVAVFPFVCRSAPTDWCRGTNLSLPSESGLPGSILASGSRDHVLDAVFEHLAARHPRFAVSFRHLATGSDVAEAVRNAARRNGLLFTQRPVRGSCVLRLEGTWERYLASRKGHLRNEIKRKLKNLEASGAVRRVTAESPSEVEPALVDVLRVEERSWKQETGTSIAAHRSEVDLFRRLALHGSSRGATRIHLIYLDDVPISHVLSMVHEGRYYAIKTSYDQSFRSLSPGVAVFEFALRYAFEARLEDFEFLGVDSRWKTEMATYVRRQADVCVFSPRRLSCGTCAAYYDRLLPTVKAVVPYWSAVRTVLRGLHPDRKAVRS